MASPFLVIDFGTAPSTRGVRTVLLVLGAVALLTAAVQMAMALRAQTTAHEELTALEPRAKKRPAGIRAAAPDAASLRAVAAIARDLQAPWPQLMAAVEASRSSDISLIQIEPVVARDSIRITADARHADAMLDYLEHLKGQGLSEVLLTSHELRVQEPGNPIRFQAQARWTALGTRSLTLTPPVSNAEDGAAAGADLAALQAFIEEERRTR